MGKKECCLNCYYCVREREYSRNSGCDALCEPLTAPQRDAVARAGDFTFLKDEMRAGQAWQRQYDLELGREKAKGVDFGDSEKENSSRLGLNRSPDVPVKNIIACRMKKWTETEQHEKSNDRDFLLSKKCSSYASFSENKDMSFEELETSVKEKNNNTKPINRSKKLIIFLLVVILLAGVVIILYVQK